MTTAASTLPPARPQLSRHLGDRLLASFGLLVMLLALAALGALLYNVAHDGMGRLSWAFLTSYPSRRAEQAGILPALAPHLFPDSFNRRIGPRIMLAVPVSFQVGQAITAATTFDVAPSGLGIRTMEPLPLGTALDLVFRLPGQTADVRASGRVSWSDRNVGMGVRFEDIAADCQGAIDRFVGDRI